MDISTFGITGVASITVICFLLAEIIKPFVMGRKNWLFVNTLGSAQASIVIYSLIETTNENSLDPYQYLLWVLRSSPQPIKEDAAQSGKVAVRKSP